MPVKSGGSHAVASFMSIVLGAILSAYLSAHSRLIHSLSESAGSFLQSVLGARFDAALPPRIAGILAISTVISFVWGVLYHRARH